MKPVSSSTNTLLTGTPSPGGRAPGRRADHRVVVLSDIEMGAGGRTDDCPDTEFITERLLTYQGTFFRRCPIHFVFNGDTFDFLKVRHHGNYPRHVTEDIAMSKLRSIHRAHPDFFETIQALLRGSHPDAHVHFVVGNHDPELLFPRVQDEIRRLCGAESRVHFPGFGFNLGDLHVEHGSQGDPLFRMDPNQRFLDYRGDQILNLPWGAVGLLETVLPYHETLFHLDRVKPKDLLFSILPEAKKLLLESAYRYWTGKFWRDLLVEKDPLKRISFGMLKELVYRFLSVDTDVSTGDYYVRAARRSSEHRWWIVGHHHKREDLRLGDRRLVQTDCLRNEFVIDPITKKESPGPRGYVEVDLCGGRVSELRTIDLDPWDVPPDYVPRSLDELRPVIETHLEQLRGTGEGLATHLQEEVSSSVPGWVPQPGPWMRVSTGHDKLEV